MFKATYKWAAVLFLTNVLFYWKITLTKQFTLLPDSEAVNQGYSWLNFVLKSLRGFHLPLWDQFAFAGRSFPGEMQTAAFYPLNLLLLPFPFDRYGLLNPMLYNYFVVFQHFLGAYFMFLLAKQLRLNSFAGFIAGCCYSFGGFFGAAWWPHMLGSSAWMPLIFLFFVRAIESPGARRALLNAMFCGLSLAMSILAGGLHVFLIQSVFLACASAGLALRNARAEVSQNLLKPVTVAIVALGVAASGAAVQLLPSHEYSSRSVRFVGPTSFPSNKRIPYFYLTDQVAPQDIVSAIIPIGNFGQGEVWKPFIGTLPFLCALIAVWTRWKDVWVRLLSFAALFSFLYALGSISLLHGLLYALVPYIWMVREASRLIFLTSFSLAVLSAYGLDALLKATVQGRQRWFDWEPLLKVSKWVIIGSLSLVFLSVVLPQLNVSTWTVYSLLILTVCCVLIRHLTKHATSRLMRGAIAFLVLFDLATFNWSATNVIELSTRARNKLQELESLQPVASFLRTQRLPFRVAFAADSNPNIGDAYSIPFNFGGTATFTKGYPKFLAFPDLLNIRYYIKRSSAPDAGSIYQDSNWKVIPAQRAFPHAWMVHTAVRQSSDDEAFSNLLNPAFDLHRVALVTRDLPVTLTPVAPQADEPVRFASYSGSAMKLEVDAQSSGLLVLSELYYPGWKAEVNGKSVSIFEVDGNLRAVHVGRGKSIVLLVYRPWLLYFGLLLSVLTFLAVPAAAIFHERIFERRPPPGAIVQ